METFTRHRLAGGIVGLLTAAQFGCSSPTENPAPPGGGDAYLLDYDQYVQAVAPVLTSQGCNSASCHGGGIRGTYQLASVDVPDPQFDFEQTRLQVNPYDPTESPILMKPLSVDAGGELHSFEPFASVDDTDYLAILAWILDGEFE